MQLAALGRTSHEAILPLGFAARQENTFIWRSQFIRRHVQAQRDVGFITRVPYPVLLYPQPIITQETGGPGSQCGAQNTIEVPGSSLGSRPCSLALAPSPTLTLTPSPALPRSRAPSPALPHARVGGIELAVLRPWTLECKQRQKMTADLNASV